MVMNVKVDSKNSCEDGIPAGPATTVMVTDEFTMVNSVPLVADGVTLKQANKNLIGDEFILVNNSGIGVANPLNVYPVAADTVNGAAGAYIIGPVFPAPGSTHKLKCIGLGQFWVTSIV